MRCHVLDEGGAAIGTILASTRLRDTWPRGDPVSVFRGCSTWRSFKSRGDLLEIFFFRRIFVESLVIIEVSKGS